MQSDMEMAESLFITILITLILSTKFLKLCSASDTLLPNQTISAGQTLVSLNHDFELGFFSPGKSEYIFLGIWYKNTPDVVVWVANRNNPISDSHGVCFSISQNGTLVISRSDRDIIWSANPSGDASHPILKLLDSGNLVLVNETAMEEGSSKRCMWQSFDWPTDTLVSGIKLVDDTDAGVVKYLTSWRDWDDPSNGDFVLRIENQGLPELVMYRGKRKMYRIGKWNGLYFGGISRIHSEVFKPEMVFRGERLISLTFLSVGSVLRRRRLDTSGKIRMYTMNAGKDRWNLAYTIPADQCDEYGLCGPNGVCSFDRPNQCWCLKGFAPRFRREWDLQDWSGGCTRYAPLNCMGGDGFQEVRGVKYPDMVEFWLNTSMSLDECKAECLKNCSCTAVANPYITNGGSGCVMWFGDLIDIRNLPGAGDKQKIHVRLPVSEVVDYESPDIKEEKVRPARVILISIVSGVIVSGFINGGIFMMRRQKKKDIKNNEEDLDLPFFEFATIVAATNNFSGKNMIGEGGFGPVYKGILPFEGEVAVKRLSKTSGQGLEEFKTEAFLIAKLQHTNLVRLLGYCIEGEERMLVYEYMQNKSLDYFVFDQNRRKLLTWSNRFNIIVGIARGLLYLHRDSRLKIIHRDLKTSNILLDKNLNPKISDFGLARILREDQPLVRTKRVAGTYGYIAPEYAIAGKFSEKSDIFSMGVVLLEIISGEKNRGFERNGDHFHSLLGQAWMLWKENRSVELMDECLKSSFVDSEVKRCIHIGLLCVQKFADDRPDMSAVLFMLGNDEAILPEPKEPGFFIGKASTAEKSAISPSPTSKRSTMTITDLEAR